MTMRAAVMTGYFLILGNFSLHGFYLLTDISTPRQKSPEQARKGFRPISASEGLLVRKVFLGNFLEFFGNSLGIL